MQQASQTRRTAVVWFVKALSLVTLVGLFIINLVGFIDTETGSAFGCGTQWPLCNGAVIPSVWGLHTLIEFMHRALVGVVTVLLLALAVLAWILYRRWLEVRILILVSVGFVFIQAALGAIGVVFGDPPAFLATHFGCSLLALAGVLLLYIVIRRIESQRGDDGTVRLRGSIENPAVRRWAWVSWFYLYVAMYVGAYVSNVGAGDQFRGWPIPTESYQTAHGDLWLDWLHRTIALGMVLLMWRLFVLTRRDRGNRPDLYRGASWALIFVVAQAFSGWFLVATHVSLVAFMIHVTVVSLLFCALCYVTMQTFPEKHPALTLDERKAAALS